MTHIEIRIGATQGLVVTGIGVLVMPWLRPGAPTCFPSIPVLKPSIIGAFGWESEPGYESAGQESDSPGPHNLTKTIAIFRNLSWGSFENHNIYIYNSNGIYLRHTYLPGFLHIVEWWHLHWTNQLFFLPDFWNIQLPPDLSSTCFCPKQKSQPGWPGHLALQSAPHFASCKFWMICSWKIYYTVATAIHLAI